MSKKPIIPGFLFLRQLVLVDGENSVLFTTFDSVLLRLQSMLSSSSKSGSSSSSTDLLSMILYANEESLKTQMGITNLAGAKALAARFKELVDQHISPGCLIEDDHVAEIVTSKDEPNNNNNNNNNHSHNNNNQQDQLVSFLNKRKTFVKAFAAIRPNTERMSILLCKVIRRFASAPGNEKYMWNSFRDAFVLMCHHLVKSDQAAFWTGRAIESCAFPEHCKKSFGTAAMAQSWCKLARSVSSSMSCFPVCSALCNILSAAPNSSSPSSSPNSSSTTSATIGTSEVVDSLIYLSNYAVSGIASDRWTRCCWSLACDPISVKVLVANKKLKETLEKVKPHVAYSAEEMEMIQEVLGHSSPSSSSPTKINEKEKKEIKLEQKQEEEEEEEEVEEEQEEKQGEKKKEQQQQQNSPSSRKSTFIQDISSSLSLTQKSIDFLTSNNITEEDFPELTEQEISELPLGDRKRILKEISRRSGGMMMTMMSPKDSSSSGGGSVSSSPSRSGGGGSFSSPASSPVSAELQKAQQRIFDVFGLEYRRQIYDENEFQIDFSQKLGGGGYGGVHACMLEGKRRVAAKVFNDFSDGIKEASLMLELCSDHELQEHVVKVEGVAAIQRKPMLFAAATEHTKLPPPEFVLMLEYAPEGSLNDKLKERAGSLSTQDIVRYSLQLAEALAGIHCRGSSSSSALSSSSSSSTSAAGGGGLDEKEETKKAACYHLDLKPGNILVFGGGTLLKLCDFGVSRASSHEQTMVTFAGRGTPIYMPPEQMTTKSVSARLDIYAFGVMMFWILTGKQPQEASEKSYDWGTMPPYQIASASREVREAMIAKVRTAARKEAPQFLVDTCVKCLSLNPNERPGNGKVLMLDMLCSCLSSENNASLKSDLFILSKLIKHRLVESEVKTLTTGIAKEALSRTQRLLSEVEVDWEE